ncbi:MAG: penicillin-binding protein 2 [Microthrixaceae bacterium]
MNSRIRRLAIVLLLCYGALVGRLTLTQVVQAPALDDSPANGRKLAQEFAKPRGEIVTADGTVVASSTKVGMTRYQRHYPTDDLFAHVVGSYSPLFGSDGVERSYGDQLSGNTNDFRFDGFFERGDESPNVGTVHLTLRDRVQEEARAALGTRKGSVVAIDPRDGAVLAMWSYPSYNPNLTADLNSDAAKKFKEAYDRSPDKPRLAKAFRDRFFPGSTFKVVTAAAGLESGRVTDDDPSYPPTRQYTPPLTSRPIRNFDGESCGGALPELLRVSCNVGFSRMGAELLGPEIMTDTAEQFGFNDVPPLDVPGAVPSVFPTDWGRRLSGPRTPGGADVYERTPLLAQAAIGQNDVSATPLQMALVAGAVGTDGRILAPHVVDSVTNRRGRNVMTYEPKVWRTPLTGASVATLHDDMVGVVTGGTASRMALSGVVVGGKTGTAQLGTTPPRSHAWVIGFAGPPGAPAEVAVAVLVEGQQGASEQTGGRVAAPIAKRVIEAALAVQAGG